MIIAFIVLYTLVFIMHGIMNYRFSVRLGLQPGVGDVIVDVLWPIELFIIFFDRRWNFDKVVEEYKWMWNGKHIDTIDENE